jgi:hypothetical protein
LSRRAAYRPPAFKETTDRRENRAMANGQDKYEGMWDQLSIWALGVAVMLLMAAFGSLETRKLDRSVFEIRVRTDDQRMDRVEQGLDRIDAKLDRLLQKE